MLKRKKNCAMIVPPRIFVTQTTLRQTNPRKNYSTADTTSANSFLTDVVQPNISWINLNDPNLQNFFY